MVAEGWGGLPGNLRPRLLNLVNCAKSLKSAKNGGSRRFRRACAAGSC